MTFNTIPSILVHVKAGRVRGLAVTGDHRSGALPDVPALAEQGLADFSALAWCGVFAPAGIPKPVLGMDLVVSSPEAPQKFLVGEIARWAKVVRENNIGAE